MAIKSPSQLKKELENIEKKQTIEKIKNDIEYDKSSTLINKVFILSSILESKMIDQDKTNLSDPVFKPIIEDEVDVEIVRRKLMDLIKQF